MDDKILSVYILQLSFIIFFNAKFKKADPNLQLFFRDFYLKRKDKLFSNLTCMTTPSAAKFASKFNENVVLKMPKFE